MRPTEVASVLGLDLEEAIVAVPFAGEWRDLQAPAMSAEPTSEVTTTSPRGQRLRRVM